MAAVAIAAPKSVSPTVQWLRDALRRHPTAIAGAIVLLLMVLIAIFAPVAGHDRPAGAVADQAHASDRAPNTGSAPTCLAAMSTAA